MAILAEAGFDIEPLLRFTHICDAFLYANLFPDMHKIIEWYEVAFKYCNDIEVLDRKLDRKNN